ncbi:MAG: type II toxin-antitoxin system RelE/ParE family toxin [Candidatus Micrarchaeota archaeon]
MGAVAPPYTPNSGILAWLLYEDAQAILPCLGVTNIRLHLPKELRQRIFEKAAAAKENPEHFFKRLEGRPDYKLRVGDYRLIADIDHGRQRIEVTLIDHRKRVYK